MTRQELLLLIEGCKKNSAASQKALFMQMYDYGMSIAHRYAVSLQDAEEIANDGFYKMLKNINKYNTEIPFKLWLRKIIINTGIDHYRKNITKKKHPVLARINTTNNLGAENLDQEYLIDLLNQLSPQYKMVFVLAIIEGYSHKEIASELDISIGTSKSNLSKARMKLKTLLLQQELKESHGR